jgi:dTDP-glucose 4,6-dehydratase
MNNQSLSKLAWKRIVVTGAGGFLGFHLSDYLLHAGALVGGLARTKGRMQELERSRNFSFLACDLEDAEDTTKKIQTFCPEILFHLAAQPDAKEELSQYHATIKANILATVNALEAFRVCGGELFIYGDSSKVYGNIEVPIREALPVKPLSSYAIAKVAGWEFCKLYARLYGFATVSVRPTLIYGPRQGTNLISYVIDAALDGQDTLRLDGGTQTRDPLYIHDAIHAFAAIIPKGRELNGRIISISGGFEITVADLAQLIVKIMGSNMRVDTDLTRMRATETMRSCCDIHEAFETIGWQPQISLEQGLKYTAEHSMGMHPHSYLAAYAAGGL